MPRRSAAAVHEDNARSMRLRQRLGIPEEITGEQVRTLIRRSGLREVDFADLLGVHPVTLSLWQRLANIKPIHYLAIMAVSRAAQADRGGEQ